MHRLLLNSPHPHPPFFINLLVTFRKLHVVIKYQEPSLVI